MSSPIKNRSAHHFSPRFYPFLTTILPRTHLWNKSNQTHFKQSLCGIPFAKGWQVMLSALTIQENWIRKCTKLFVIIWICSYLTVGKFKLWKERKKVRFEVSQQEATASGTQVFPKLARCRVRCLSSVFKIQKLGYQDNQFFLLKHHQPKQNRTKLFYFGQSRHPYFPHEFIRTVWQWKVKIIVKEKIIQTKPYCKVLFFSSLIICKRRRFPAAGVK